MKDNTVREFCAKSTKNREPENCAQKSTSDMVVAVVVVVMVAVDVVMAVVAFVHL